MYLANRSAFLKRCFCTHTNEQHLWHSPRMTFTEKGFYCFKMSSSLSRTPQDLIPALAGFTLCTHTRNDYTTFERNSKSQVQLTSLHRSRSLQLALLSVVQTPAPNHSRAGKGFPRNCQQRAAVVSAQFRGTESALSLFHYVHRLTHFKAK